MFKSYLKIGLRNLLRHKTYSAINILGLAAGLVCCLFILLYISDELSFDRYHAKADRIRRIALADWARTPAALAPAMTSSYPHLVESIARMWPLFAPAKMRYDDKVFVETGGFFADAALFSIFSWPMVSGNPSRALLNANSIVMTESMAVKYFGSGEPVGQTVRFWGQDMTVTGVIRDIPLNSHLRFDFLVSFPSLENAMGNNLDHNWGLPDFYTYIVTPEGVTDGDILDAAGKLLGPHFPDHADVATVQPLTRLHLHSDMEGDFVPGGNVAYLYTLATAALMVLLLACINFTNLTTARAATRTREVGIRKVMGARRKQLIGQFFGEAILMSAAAFVIAVFVVHGTLPVFNHLTGKNIDGTALLEAPIGLSLAAITVFIGLVAGAYPALYLSKFNPVTVLKGTGGLPVPNLFVRKSLTVFQFTLSTVFLIGIAVVVLQLNYLQTRNLGFDKDQVLVLDGDNFSQLQVALAGVSGVAHVAGVPQVPGADPLPSSQYKAENVPADSLHRMARFGATPGFIETMAISLVAGRSFQAASPDEQSAFILNETAIRELGWTADDAIGRSFSIRVPPVNGGADVWRDGKVIGVIADFHYESLYEAVGPLVLYPSDDFNLTLVRVTQTGPPILEAIASVWKKVNPDAPFNYYFLDDRLAKHYEAEEKLGSFLSVATALAVIIACLGLFGLVAFSAAQRTKEIGIRKVMGATVAQIVTLLTSEFLKLVSLAVVLAIPLAYAVMSEWLDNFAYHIRLSWIIFAAAGALAIAIAFITVCFQSIKAAVADLVESMRYE